LVVRSHPSALSFINSLLTLLDDGAIAWDAARALGVLVADDGVLTKRNSAVLKVGETYTENAARYPHLNNPDSPCSEIFQYRVTKGDRRR